MAARSSYRLVLFLIIAVAITLVSLTFKNIHFAASADEGYYFSYASSIADRGVSGFSALFQGYLENQRHWLYPNPLRVGFIGLSAIWLKITGVSFMNMAYLSLAFFVLFLLTSYYFSRRYLGEKMALLFVTLLAFSPIQLAMSRRALMDSAVNFFSYLSIWLFWDFLKKKGRLKLIFFIGAYSFSILVKETALLLAVSFLILLLVDRFVYKNKCSLKEFSSVLLLPPFIALAAYALLGCLPYIFDTVKIILNSPQANSYALLFGSGPWYRYLIDYMVLSPWVVILSIGFIFYFILDKANNELAAYFVVIFLVNLALFNFFTKNLRYVMILDLPLRLFSLLMLNIVANKFFPRQAIKIVSALAIVLVLSDYLNFYHLFVQESIYDPVSFYLLKARRIIPFN
ncbi:MAG: glycosyltransferase family 39 protein [Candidatus Omnitrophota bacterium]